MTRKMFVRIFLTVFLLMGGSLPSGVSGTWIEDFTAPPPLETWKKTSTRLHDTWQPKGGHLDVWIQPLARALFDNYLLEFTGFPLEAEQLSVSVRILERHNVNLVGIVIGQYTPDRNPSRRTYMIGANTSLGAGEFPSQIPDIRYKIEGELKIVFDRGHFEVFSSGKKVFGFEEPNLPKIDCLGLCVFLHHGPLGHVVLDDFIISGPSVPSKGGLAVRSEKKLAVLWGEVKRK